MYVYIYERIHTLCFFLLLAKHARALQREKNYYMLMANNNRNKTFIYVGASLYSRPHCKKV